VSDKLTQNEVEELQEKLQQSSNADTSLLRTILDRIPDEFFGGKHQSDKIDEIQNNANAAQLQNMSVTAKKSEEYTEYVKQIFAQIMPAIEFHDDVMKSISIAADKIPFFNEIIEQLEEQLSMFVFSIIAPFVVPVIKQIRNELKTGSQEIIETSENEQHVVFNDDDSSNPTHSMLSKDHFTNVR
jgi:DNA repair exonuclease SbcCD ATPase subunit